MPVYEYECKLHGEFEEIRSMKDPPLDICPKCKLEKIKKPLPPKRLIGLSNFVLVGGGWGKDLYGSKK